MNSVSGFLNIVDCQACAGAALNRLGILCLQAKGEAAIAALNIR